METKICSSCKKTKTVDSFSIKRKTKDGLNYRCKECENIKAKEYSLKNKHKIKEKWKNYYEKNKERLKTRAKIDYYKNIEKRQQTSLLWKKNNSEYLKEYAKTYTSKNKKKIAKKDNEYRKRRKKEDNLFKLKTSIRSMIASCFSKKGFSKRSKTEEILGCTFEEFKAHIEAQFKPGMSWERRSEFHIDHKIPLASAKTEEDVIKLCHYTNLQPLWAHENLAKGAKITS